MSDCVFCEIENGRGEATFVFRDDLVSAIVDIEPVNPGHVLVIPRQHATSLADLPEETGARMFQVAMRVDRALRRSGLPCQGVSLFLADGAVAGQEIFHVHLHVIPRFAGDGFGFRFPHGYPSRPARARLEEAAEKIRRGIE